jgi:hypothetical protein
MDFRDNFRGEVRITSKNSKNVVLPPDAEDYDPDTWPEVTTTKWMSPQDIERIYNKQGIAKELQARKEITYDMYDIPRDMFGKDTRHYWSVNESAKLRRFVRVIERQYKEFKNAPHFVDPVTGDIRLIPETWERERIAYIAEQMNLAIIDRKVERIFWYVSAGSLYELHDEISPYKHFTVVPYFPYFLKGRTMGLAENLLSPQDVLNKSVSQELHIVNTTANSGWDIEEDQLVNMDEEELEQRGAQTGLVVVRRKGSPPLTKIQPNQVPTGVDRLSYKADEYIKYISGNSDSKRGFDREDVAAKAIKAKQAAGAINLVKPLFNLHLTDQLLVRNVIDLVQEYYTEERVLQITGGGLLPETETVVVNQRTPEGTIANDLTIGEYEAIITTVPARDNYEESQFEEAIRLREMGIAIPDDVIVEHSHLQRKGEIAKRIRELNGGAEPSEAQMQIQQLEVQLKQLEVEEKQAQVMKYKADAGLALMKAKEAGTRAESDNGESAELEKLVLEREKMLQEIKFKREEMREELRLKREEMREQLKLKREEMQMNARLKAQEVRNKAKEASSSGKPAES